MLRASILSIILFMTACIGPDGMEALSRLTGLQVYEGTYIFLDETRDVAIKARGVDELGGYYRILGRLQNGYPYDIFVMEPEERT